MKINYTYKSNFFQAINVSLLLLVMWIGSLAFMAKNKEALTTLMIIFFIIWCISIILFSYIPVKMVADENMLKVRKLFWKTVIRYSDITSISLDHEFRKAEMRGEQNHYNEILKITDINKNEYFYYRKLDLDQDKIAKDPADLAVQFENSKFSKLKTYIEERIPIMRAEKI